MSSSSSSSNAEDEGREQPIVALAGDIGDQEELFTDISESPAFQCLDELFSIGKITGTRVAELKAKYISLHETLKSSQESEIQLLQDAKYYASELEKQQQELNKADQFPEVINTEVSKLRKQLLLHQNNLCKTQEREYILQYKLQQ
nr:PREDICTED: coiled-coil domain-containing protein 146-like [Latimeria chalumnae]|eukprot:XP_014351218.1 PREDICTED: coiled-coil domain-containing protein 146-like [Latimeria chalumnae]